MGFSLRLTWWLGVSITHMRAQRLSRCPQRLKCQGLHTNPWEMKKPIRWVIRNLFHEVQLSISHVCCILGQLSPSTAHSKIKYTWCVTRKTVSFRSVKYVWTCFGYLLAVLCLNAFNERSFMNDRSWTRSYFGRTWTERTYFCLMNVIVNVANSAVCEQRVLTV